MAPNFKVTALWNRIQKTKTPTYSEQRMWLASLEGQYKPLGARRSAFIPFSGRYSWPEKLIQSVLCRQERCHSSPAYTKYSSLSSKQNCGAHVTWRGWWRISNYMAGSCLHFAVCDLSEHWWSDRRSLVSVPSWKQSRSSPVCLTDWPPAAVHGCRGF